MGAVEEMMCIVCVRVTEGDSGDGCVLASTLCKYDLYMAPVCFYVCCSDCVGSV